MKRRWAGVRLRDTCQRRFFRRHRRDGGFLASRRGGAVAGAARAATTDPTIRPRAGNFRPPCLCPTIMSASIRDTTQRGISVECGPVARSLECANNLSFDRFSHWHIGGRNRYVALPASGFP
jgi:hypothetical protein